MRPRWTRARFSPGENPSERHSLRCPLIVRWRPRLGRISRVCPSARAIRAASYSYLGGADVEGRARNTETRVGTPIPPARPKPGRARMDTKATQPLQAASRLQAQGRSTPKTAQCSFRRHAVTGKDRNHGEFSQSPAADRDRNDHRADHDYEQDHRIGKRQREALRASDQPNDDNGECVDETSKAQ